MTREEKDALWSSQCLIEKSFGSPFNFLAKIIPNLGILRRTTRLTEKLSLRGSLFPVYIIAQLPGYNLCFKRDKHSSSVLNITQKLYWSTGELFNSTPHKSGTYIIIIGDRRFSITWPASMEIYRNKKSVCIRNVFNSHRIGLGH